MTRHSLMITAPADSGNIDVLDAADPGRIRLAIRPDGKAAFHQWFYFRVSGAKSTPLKMAIENAGSSSYVKGWEGARVFVSDDHAQWRRVNTVYRDGHLVIEHTPAKGVCWFAYFVPYPTTALEPFLGRIAASPLAVMEPLGRTLDGLPIDHIQVGEPGPGKKTIWAIARQHPGEAMGSFWMEGFLPRLLDEKDAAAARLREGAVVHVVPMMNPDGIRRGHLRTNAAGTDLNRAWQEPSLETSPEVFHVRGRMMETGCDLFIDVHGDEVIPNVFIDGTEGIPGWSDRLAELEKAYTDALLAITPDFQTVMGYPVAAPGQANLRIANSWVGQHFDCLSMTLEMPFQDAAVQPDDKEGWSPVRCEKLGRDCLEAMAAVLDRLR